MYLSNLKYFKIIFMSAFFLILAVSILSTESYATAVTTGAGTVVDVISAQSNATVVTTSAGTVIDVVPTVDTDKKIDDRDNEMDIQTSSDLTSDTSNYAVDEVINVTEEVEALEIYYDDGLLELTDSIEGLSDVNNSGEYTLLDLGIDARHFGKDPKSSELSEYNTDIVVNNAIDDDDLLEISRRMMLNSNYEH